MLLLAADPQTGRSWTESAGATWPLWLPLLVGAAAIFCLLPRPRAYPWVLGALLGVVALVLAGVFLVHPGPWTAETAPGTFLFYLFSGVAIVAGALLVTQHNPARAALSFALVVLSTCGLFLLLAAPFLMAATIIVYAGAIIVTFLFVLMLAQQQGHSDADDRSREPLLSSITGFVLLGALLYVLKLGYHTRELDDLLGEVRQGLEEQDAKKLHEQMLPKGGNDLFERTSELMAAYGWVDLKERARDLLWDEDYITSPDNIDNQHKVLAKLEAVLMKARERMGIVQPSANLPLSPLSGTPANTPPAEIRRDPITRLPQLPAQNAGYLGRSLFTDYLLPVELAGTLLLVATIGAVAIGQRRENKERTS
jgi:NADH-quinone oxidoreductase subunit J